MSKGPKLAEIAERISVHLKRFESDTGDINRDEHGHGVNGRGLRPYYLAQAVAVGSRVFVQYISYQGHSSLKKNEALAYLEWLDAGNVGRHFEAAREVKP